MGTVRKAAVGGRGLLSANAESPVAGFSFQSLMSGVRDLLYWLSLLSESTCENMIGCN